MRLYSYVLTVSDSYYALGNYKSALKYSPKANAVKNLVLLRVHLSGGTYKLSSLDEADKAANDSGIFFTSKLGNARGMGHAIKVLVCMVLRED